MISGELQFLRKHTGGVVQEMNSRITDSINELEAHFQRMLKHSYKMKERELYLFEAARLAGSLFITEDIITPTQLNEVKRQLLNPSYKDFEEENLWSFYNHVTHSLKKSHPTTYIQQHKNFHEYIIDEFGLV